MTDKFIIEEGKYENTPWGYFMAMNDLHEYLCKKHGYGYKDVSFKQFKVVSLVL